MNGLIRSQEEIKEAILKLTQSAKTTLEIQDKIREYDKDVLKYLKSVHKNLVSAIFLTVYGEKSLSTDVDNFLNTCLSFKNKGTCLRASPLYERIKEATSYLKGKVSLSQRIWHIKNSIEEIPKCKAVACKKETKWQDRGLKRGYYARFCSTKCSNSDEETKMRAIETNRKRFGFDYPLQNPKLLKEREDLIVKRYGLKTILQLPEVQEKIKSTNLEKYGYENPFFSREWQDQNKERNIKKHGSANPFQWEHIKEKIKSTNLELYGVENPMQRPEVAERSQENAFLRKEIEVNGVVFSVQGFEGVVIQHFVNIGIDPSSILTKMKDMPELWYEFKGKRCRYFPDTYIPKMNLIMEVKSTYTVGYNNSETFKRVQLKAESTVDAGYNYLVWVMSEKGNTLRQFRDSEILNIEHSQINKIFSGVR